MVRPHNEAPFGQSRWFAYVSICDTFFDTQTITFQRRWRWMYWKLGSTAERCFTFLETSQQQLQWALAFLKRPNSRVVLFILRNDQTGSLFIQKNTKGHSFHPPKKPTYPFYRPFSPVPLFCSPPTEVCFDFRLGELPSGVEHEGEPARLTRSRDSGGPGIVLVFFFCLGVLGRTSLLFV